MAGERREKRRRAVGIRAGLLLPYAFAFAARAGDGWSEKKLALLQLVPLAFQYNGKIYPAERPPSAVSFSGGHYSAPFQVQAS